MRIRISALCLIVALNGCGLPANVVILLPDEAGTVGKISVERNKTQEELSTPYSAAETGARENVRGVFKTDPRTVQAEFSSVLASTPRKPDNFVIYFLLGRTELDPRSFATLDAVIKVARTTPFADISVVGHSDATGNDDANFVLSMYRAQAIRAALLTAGRLRSRSTSVTMAPIIRAYPGLAACRSRKTAGWR